MTREHKNFFYPMASGQVFISLFFLIGRLIDGMPFYEALGKFTMATTLGIIIVFFFSFWIGKWAAK